MELEIIKKCNSSHTRSIIFVHGAYHAAWCWTEYFLDYFYNQGLDVYAFSFRNHGKSEKVEKVYSITVTDLVEDLEQVIALVQKDIVIIAHSLGCRIVGKYLEKKFHSIKGIVYISPMPVRHNIFQLARMQKQQKHMSLADKCFSGRLTKKEEEYYADLMEEESYKVEYSMMKKQKQYSKKVLQIPSLILGSLADQCILTQTIYDNASLLQANVVFFNRLCHNMMLDPEWKNAADVILQFIKGIDMEEFSVYNDN